MAEPAVTHVPVLAEPVVDWLSDASCRLLVDCTVGLAGHAGLLLEAMPDAQLIGLDRDSSNLAIARHRLATFGERVRLVHASFSDLGSVLDDMGVIGVDRILADLGLSSNQIADASRGFSFDVDGPLDMRLDPSQSTTAADLVNGLPEQPLADLLYIQSQERHSRRISRRICEARRRGRLNSTVELARLVESAVGQRAASRSRRIHPATRTFMALRMAVNRETEVLQHLLTQAADHLVSGGRIAMISFHSGEDRIVKQDFRGRFRQGAYRLLTRKPIVAGLDERRRNPRSRSAKLRVAERVGATA
ncbi:MAG: 16S rRNA (cytosine(1402)-N(4))-methyltransferase RsmH [Phycisphaerae bacterium]